MDPMLHYLADNWIPLAIVLVVIGICLRIVWRAVMPPKRLKPVKPQCEACGYAVEGLESMTCPECGGDFRSVGIITPRMEARRRGSYGGALLAWILACAVFLLFVHELVVFSFFESGWFGPARRRWDVQKLEIVYVPASLQYNSVTLEYTTDSRQQTLLSPLTATIRTLDDRSISLELDSTKPI